MKNVPVYVLTSSLLSIGAYLHSSIIVCMTVVLWGLSYAESVLTRTNKDADITALVARMEKLEKDHKGLTQDITNVAERAKTILGEVY